MIIFIQDRRQLLAHGLLHGFRASVWSVVLINALGGLLVAACMKLAGNIEKCFATSVAIVSHHPAFKYGQHEV